MKSFITSFACLLIIVSSYMAKAQESKNYPAKNFNSIGVSSGIDLYLTQGSSEAVTIKSDSETLKDIIVEQNGSNINIKFRDGINWSGLFKNRTIKAYVNYKTLTALAASGGSDVFTQNQLKTDKLAIRSSGGSDLKLNVVCNDITIQSSGGSDIGLKGKAENMTIQSSGGSDIDAYEFVTNYAKVQASGGSDVGIFVNKGLEAAASGGGDVSYKGNASLKKTSSSKSGDVHHVN
ncbi:head GIN domain-containing protein [Pedobacter agri]|uniref:head GIN domain-containing protein n=1 Tax=Pedobacter agri TaxID=454586 RepID=UPI002930B20E|nr:head GIN domain-containing protein [Pedobacter agri]